jgi:hypothetical protein
MVGRLTQSWQVKAANPSASVRTGLRTLLDDKATLSHAFVWCDPPAALGTGLVKVRRGELVQVLGH